ncbi:MAG: HhH-GPD-type base excision DNA repair protein [Angustibacter sp.]
MAFHIAGEPEADEVLDEQPFALVVGMMLDQQYGMEHAFRGGYKVLSRFGTLEPAAIAAAEPESFKALCSQPPAIHRFPGSMAARLQELAALVDQKYDGDVTRLWTEPTTGQELLARVQELPGFGKQKAQIFVALLAKQLGVRPEGWERAAGDYALEGYRSVADVVDPGSLLKVREYKQQKKAAAKAATVKAAR